MDRSKFKGTGSKFEFSRVLSSGGLYIIGIGHEGTVFFDLKDVLSYQSLIYQDFAVLISRIRRVYLTWVRDDLHSASYYYFLIGVPNLVLQCCGPFVDK